MLCRAIEKLEVDKVSHFKGPGHGQKTNRPKFVPMTGEEDECLSRSS